MVCRWPVAAVSILCTSILVGCVEQAPEFQAPPVGDFVAFYILNKDNTTHSVAVHFGNATLWTAEVGRRYDTSHPRIVRSSDFPLESKVLNLTVDLDSLTATTTAIDLHQGNYVLLEIEEAEVLVRQERVLPIFN